ncbi:MAG: DMT family transporter [Acidimicrobiales bacterium]
MITGISLALGSGLLFASGNLAQKRGVDALRRFTFQRPISTLASLLRSRIWLLGAVLSVAGAGTQLAAYRFASIAVVQSISGFGIIILLVVPRSLFGERPTRHEFSGAILALIAFGLVVASVAGNGQVSGTHFVSARTEYAMIAMTVFAASALSLGLQKRHAGGALYGLSSGTLYGAMGIGLKGASNAFASSDVRSAAVHLLTGPIPYSVLVAWIFALLVFQIGIQRSRLSVVAPLSSVVTMVSVITVGTPLFGERWPSSTLYFSLRVVGVVTILIALALALYPTRGQERAAPAALSQEESKVSRGSVAIDDIVDRIE